MKNHYLKALFFGVISLLLISCAGQQVQTTAPTFTPYTFKANQYVPKVDNFVVILDTSSSMADKYNGTSKAEIAKKILNGDESDPSGTQVQWGASNIRPQRLFAG